MTYDEALRFLAERQETKWKLGLSRIESLLSSLGDPQDAVPTIHVAGTNGKGTFCAMLSSSLREAGYRAGMFTSPHLVGPTERIRVDGKPIPPGEFGRMIDRARAAEDEPASYFELVTGAGLEFFRERKVDVAVVEVGMGGRLDATNAVREPLLTVITSIGFDHMVHLGDTLPEIAGEKAGILKRGVPCLCGDIPPEALETIRGKAESLGAPLLFPESSLKCGKAHWSEGSRELETPDGRRLTVGLLGRSAAPNASLAMAAAAVLRRKGFDIPDDALARGLAQTDWRGRFQVERLGGKTLILDGAHNVPAVEALAETWDESPWSREDATFIFGCLRDKEYGSVLRILAPRMRRVILTRPETHRAKDPRVLADELRALRVRDVSVIEDPLAAFRAWRESAVPVGVVCGSLYVVGRVLGSLSEVPA